MDDEIIVELVSEFVNIVIEVGLLGSGYMCLDYFMLDWIGDYLIEEVSENLMFVCDIVCGQVLFEIILLEIICELKIIEDVLINFLLMVWFVLFFVVLFVGSGFLFGRRFVV